MLLKWNTNVYFVKIYDTVEEQIMINERTDMDNDKYYHIKGDNDFIYNNLHLDINDNESLIFCDLEMIRKYKALFDMMGFRTDVIDAKELLFNDKLNLSSADLEFKKTVQDYILKHFDVNAVLDKMNENIQLTETDYMILKNI